MRFASAIALLLIASRAIVFASCIFPGVTPSTLPWPGGIIPYAFHTNLTTPQRATYLAGIREWELAANIQFIPRTTETNYLLLTYDANAPINYVTGTNPAVMTLNLLTRHQIAHETGHALGLNHENTRTDRDSYLTILTNNIDPGNAVYFVIQSNDVPFGAYDFESVMHLAQNFGSINPPILNTMVPKPPNTRFAPRLGNVALSPGDRAAAAYLYGPGPTLTNVVTTTSDTGPGSLRAAIYYAADHPGATIRFDIPTTDPGHSNGVYTIQPRDYLPLLADGTIIDGSTQPGFNGAPLIVIDGSQVIPEAQNTSMLLYAANCSIKNLAFNQFTFCGLLLLYPECTNNFIQGCYIGIQPASNTPAPNATQGILIALGASRNQIGGTNSLQRNVVSGNPQYGVFITDTNTAGNVVSGNFIGPGGRGTNAVANGLGGLLVGNGSHHNVIGGTAPGAGNVISGNTHAGLWITGPGVNENVVQGNYFGTDYTGTNALGNTFAGVNILNGAKSNLLGGTAPGSRNIISGNGSEGIRIADPGTSDNAVQGNFIGLGHTGLPLPNGFLGIAIYNAATNNRIGGTTSDAHNVVSGNAVEGIRIADPGTSGNSVQGNLIGMNTNGTAPAPNGFVGVALFNGASANLIGGTNVDARNVISGNGGRGMTIADPGTASNVVQGNYIGVAADGISNAGNSWDGITLLNGAHNNVIGLDPTGSGAGNVIAKNAFDGVAIYDDSTTGNTIRGNATFDNGGLGINLVGGTQDGFSVTTNDVNDADSGPNHLQNHPAITTALVYSGTTLIGGILNSISNRSYQVDVYRNTAADDSGYGEGQVYVGSATLNTDANGNGTFTVGAAGSFAGQQFAVTATDAATGDTSEFGRTIVATNGPSPIQELTPLTWSGTNGFIFNVALQTNLNYRIQASTNLPNGPWIDLTNFLATNSLVQFVDRAATNQPARFYRAVSP